MSSKYNTSVNIIRDSDRDFHYIPTPNAKQVVGQIVNDFKKGIRSFNLVGTYGTGKSSFLLAFEQSLIGYKRYFDPYFLAETKYDFVKIIGDYSSITDRFAEEFEVQSQEYLNQHILSEIFNRYTSIESENKILFIFIDELGKFLEYATKNNPESELYFIQQLAEFCNNSTHNIVLITTVHQNLDSYAYSLTKTQQQEWTKVKGRFREITFNEPVEQLLYLASEHVEKHVNASASKLDISRVLKLTTSTKAFNFNNEFIQEIAPKLYPLDILSANTLTLSLQKYGQNERSLFSFLESSDHTGISRYDKRDNPFFNLSNVYDYLYFNFYSFLTSKYNPDFTAWSSIRSSIEEVERSFDTSIQSYLKTVKTIGLLNIFSASGSVLDSKFLFNYLKYACGVDSPEEIVKNLEAKNIIRYRYHSKRYILFEGTDLDIENALIEAGNKISEVVDITTLLNKYLKFSPVFAKQYSYTKGTPRYFDFIISDIPIQNKIPLGEIDGYVNLILNSRLSEHDVQAISKQQEEAIVYCFFLNSIEIKSLLFEIEKTQKVLEENQDDKVAKRELEIINESQVRLLKHFLADSIYSDSKDVRWFFKGDTITISSKKDFNKFLSSVCSRVYPATPTFRNELVNKHSISTSIHTAKRNYFKALSNHWDKDNLGFEDSKFPPEKTIYLSLLAENHIAPNRAQSLDPLTFGANSSFTQLWNASQAFLESAKTETLKISDFCELLKRRPFKLKQGFIDFWVPTFLFLKRDDIAIFNEDIYIPTLSDDNLELIAKNPADYSIKTFDIDGVKLDIFNSYRTFLNQSEENAIDNNSFIETIKPFIIFYKKLPEYSKNTSRLSPAALKIREAISTSKNPESTFFDAFPNALGVSIHSLQNDKTKLQSYITSLQDSIREIRVSYDELIARIEEFICSEFVGEPVSYEVYKTRLQQRYSRLKRHMLLSQQKTFVQRLDSPLDDKKDWLNSIAQSLTGKTIVTFSDSDEILLYERFRAMIIELDSLTELSKADVDESKEDVIRVQIESFLGRIDPVVVRVPKNRSVEIDKIKAELSSHLGSDSTTNIAAVLNLLKELLK